MSDATEKLRQELRAAQEQIAALQAKLGSSEAMHRLATLELEENRSALLFMLEDLENARRKIEQSHREWVDALDVVSDPIFMHNGKHRILRCNKAYQRCAGVPFAEILGRPYYEVFPKSDAPLPCCLRALEKSSAQEEEVTVGDAIYRMRAFPIYDEYRVYLYSVHILEDVTESRRIEALLRDNEQNYRTLADSAPALIWASGLDKLCNYFNRPWLGFTGRTLEQEMGNGWAEGVHPEDLQHCLDVYLSAFERHEPFSMEYRLRRHDGEYRWMRDDGCPRYDSEGNFTGYIGYLMDVTERRQAEQALRESEETYRSLFENTLNGIAHCRMIFEGEAPVDIEYIRVNRGFEKVTGLKGVEGRRISEVIPGYCRDNPESIATFGRVARTGESTRWEHYLAALDRWFAFSIYSPAQDEVVIVSDNITERKKAEIELQRANRALAALSSVNRNLVRADDEAQLLQSICAAIVEQRGYRMAWVGYAQHDENKSVRIMASAGHVDGYLDKASITWVETEHGMGPTGCAIRSNEMQVCNDIAGDPGFRPWREAALQRGYRSSIALPLANGEVFGSLMVYASEANAFSKGEIGLLQEMAEDLAFGVHMLHVRAERDRALEQSQQNLERLQSSLEATVSAIAGIVELRDPYTAGHQARVADLAAAIARQMGLSEERVHGIHLAGIIHDLGKIQIPAEILSKPGRLSEIEQSLIRIHPRAGYDILKNIDFPWPIADKVLQHHERFDGSGYPQGLKGEEISLGARIISVADTVEAMSSHRPYRPGLGLDNALEEITRQRGTLFDPQVVDACLALFREKGYHFG